MDDKTRQMLEYFDLVDECEKYGGEVHVAKNAVLPTKDGKMAFVRVILTFSDNPNLKGKVV